MLSFSSSLVFFILMIIVMKIFLGKIRCVSLDTCNIYRRTLCPLNGLSFAHHFLVFGGATWEEIRINKIQKRIFFLFLTKTPWKFVFFSMNTPLY